MSDILIGRKANGEYLYIGGDEHVALHARTGTGKDVGFVLPNCFAYPGSMIILDIKGEAWRHTAGHRKSMGQDVFLFDPASTSGRSHRWDPFSQVNRTGVERFDQIARHANLIFPEIDQIGGGANNNKFWDDAGRQAFTAIATILAECPEQNLTMESICRMFRREDGHQIINNMILQRSNAGNPLSQLAIDGASDYAGNDTKLRNEIRKTVSTRLQLWASPKTNAVTAVSDFDLREFRRKPTTLYVVAAPGNIARLRPLLRLLFDQAINMNTDTTPEEDPSLKVPLMFMLNEFARLGRVDTLAHAPQFVRAYGIRMAFVVQSKAQLRSIYGHDGVSDIFDNLGAEIVFGTVDPDLTSELEKRMGDNTVLFRTKSMPRFFAWMRPGRQNESEHPHRRPLMLDQEIAQMSPDDQIVIRAGMRPMKSKRICWYQDANFSTRVRPAPLVPELNIVIDRGPVNAVVQGTGPGTGFGSALAAFPPLAGA